jgi:hypothetical protein
MDVVTLCRLPVASLLWQPRASTWMLTVVCKATYQLRPSESVLADEQEAPNEEDNYWNDDAGRSLHAASDLVPVKPRVDVVLVGHAFAPGRKPARSLVARLVVGEIDKSIEVFCDRNFSQDGALHEGARFERMPLVYERAAGGPETTNPVGVRRDVKDMYGRIAVPNLQPPDILVSTRADFITPTGFGPISPTWPLRRDKLGRHAAAWSVVDWRRQPLPDDIDLSYFNHAPRDQQVQALRDNERIVLENMHPDQARLATNLPGARPRATVERIGGTPQPVVMRCDTLWIDTDRSICTLTWRAQVPLEHPQERGRVVIMMDQPGQSVAWVGAALGHSQDSAAHAHADDGTGTLVEPLRPPPGIGEDNPLAGTLTVPGAARGTAALPFSPGAPAAQAYRGDERAAKPSAGLPFGAAPQAAFDPPRQGLGQSSTAWANPEQTAAAPPPPRPKLSSSSWEVADPAPPPPPQAPPVTVEMEALRVPAPPPLVRAPASVDPVAPLGASSPWVAGDARRADAAIPMTVGQLAAQPSSAVAAMPAPVAHLDAPRPAAAPATRFEAGEVMQLVWFDPEIVPRARRRPAWRKVLDALEEKPLDADLDDPALAKDPMDMEDRRDIFEILARGEAVGEEGLNSALAGAVRDDGKFVPALVLIGGELIFPFDELETLKATVTIASPLAAGDELLKSAVHDAREFLGMPDMLSSPGVTEGFTSRIEDAFRKGKRGVPATYLETQTERALLEKRHYQKREVFGAPHLRALLQVGGSSRLVPAYLPEALAKKLPMYVRFRARIIAEVHLQEDQYETHPAALRVTALGRVTAAQRPQVAGNR